jgi:hypothetical protein
MALSTQVAKWNYVLLLFPLLFFLGICYFYWPAIRMLCTIFLSYFIGVIIIIKFKILIF